ncbi:MAG TPA: helix-turn-helix domain-containing protein [Bacillus bacterium]|nr:helix-turn-helix domain-containing protein [Bacillus sp. (in: firmicutes)]
MNENFDGVGVRIAQKLNELGISQKDVYSVTGFSKTTMSNYVNGRRLPSTIELYKLSKFFSVSMEWLLTGEKPDHQPASTPTIEKNFLPFVDLSPEDLEFIAKFRQLSERQKGRIEGQVEEMLGGTSSDKNKKLSVSKNGKGREEGGTREGA